MKIYAGTRTNGWTKRRNRDEARSLELCTSHRTAWNGKTAGKTEHKADSWQHRPNYLFETINIVRCDPISEVDRADAVWDSTRPGWQGCCAGWG